MQWTYLKTVSSQIPSRPRLFSNTFLRFSERIRLFKTDVLQCSAMDLNTSLCLFCKEVASRYDHKVPVSVFDFLNSWKTSFATHCISALNTNIRCASPTARSTLPTPFTTFAWVCSSIYTRTDASTTSLPIITMTNSPPSSMSFWGITHLGLTHKVYMIIWWLNWYERGRMSQEWI